MDRDLEKYRFGITLELKPGAYQFGTDTTPPVFVSTICKLSVKWMNFQGVTLIDYGNNSYICSEIYDLNIIRALLQDFWQSNEFNCPENIV